MFDISYPVAFGAGVVSFFAPCVVALLPAYVGYVTGVSVKDLKKEGRSLFRGKLLSSSLLYILGFSLVFVVLGTTAASIGVVFRRYDFLIQRIGGLVLLVLGLEFAGVLNLKIFAKQRKFSLPSWSKKLGPGRSFLVGVVFAASWTPCVGAVLGSILTLAAVSGTAMKGASLLFVYSLGISIPFILIALGLASASKYVEFFSKHAGKIAKVSGIILAILGLLLLTDTYKYLNAWLFEIAYSLGYEIR